LSIYHGWLVNLGAEQRTLAFVLFCPLAQSVGKLRFPNDCKVATMKTAMFISFNEPEPAGLFYWLKARLRRNTRQLAG
jgi:hypothetical protein